jgi:hypothetical protein
MGMEYIIHPTYPHPELSATFAHDNAAVCSVIAQTINPANIRSIRHLNKDGQKLWQGLKTAHQDSSSGGVMYYMQKLFLSQLQDDDIEAHLVKMSGIFERLNALSNPERPLTQDDFFATAIFTLLLQEWLPCVSALTNKPYVASSKVIAALKQEGLRRKAQAKDILEPALVSSAKTKPQSTSGNHNGVVKRCTFCNVDGHDLNTCFNTVRILREAKAWRHQGNDRQSDSTQPTKKKKSKQPSKPAAKGGRTSVAQLGSLANDKGEETNCSGSEIGVVSHQAVCSLLTSATPHPVAIGDLNLDSGCSMTMLPTAAPLLHLRGDKSAPSQSIHRGGYQEGAPLASPIHQDRGQGSSRPVPTQAALIRRQLVRQGPPGCFHQGWVRHLLINGLATHLQAGRKGLPPQKPVLPSCRARELKFLPRFFCHPC